ncbi:MULTISPECIES: DUF1173 family protein [Cysteiniphilum]|uniref:DUF1173 family protein n=1 Tax=Cysteiniphilum litorale TaxID=2056700 RepID=A0A8J2Z332_9GAMM|nr:MULTISPECIES: DUF1173 family protein [Cysteiniphilum]GGF92154.1 hypothetical protein GCM10010995_06680 [Cysteiniphilum litorale]
MLKVNIDGEIYYDVDIFSTEMQALLALTHDKSKDITCLCNNDSLPISIVKGKQHFFLRSYPNTTHKHHTLCKFHALFGDDDTLNKFRVDEKGLIHAKLILSEPLSEKKIPTNTNDKKTPTHNNITSSPTGVIAKKSHPENLTVLLQFLWSQAFLDTFSYHAKKKTLIDVFKRFYQIITSMRIARKKALDVINVIFPKNDTIKYYLSTKVDNPLIIGIIDRVELHKKAYKIYFIGMNRPVFMSAKGYEHYVYQTIDRVDDHYCICVMQVRVVELKNENGQSMFKDIYMAVDDSITISMLNTLMIPYSSKDELADIQNLIAENKNFKKIPKGEIVYSS